MPAYYLDMHALLGTTMAGQMLSMICSGLFDQLPELQVVAVETGIAWVASLSWTIDDAWRAFGERGDPPACADRRRSTCARTGGSPPSRSRSPTIPSTCLAFDAIGMVDRILFSSDYPHWDFDSPDQTLPRSISKEDKAKIFAGNACRLYRLPRR